MATYPDISLAVKPPPQIDPLGSFQKVVSIKDSLAQIQERQDMTAQRKFALQQSMAKQADQDALETAIGQHTSVGDDGLVTTNHKAAVDSLKDPKLKAQYQAIIPQLDKEALQHSTDRLAMQHQSIQSQLALATEAKAALDAAPDLPAKQQAWAAIVPKWSAVDRTGAVNLPRQYDPATVDPLLTGVIAHGQAENDKTMTSLQFADAKKAAADAAMTLSKIQPSTPEGMTNKATRMADTVKALSEKYKDMDPERLDSIMESVGLPKITRKTVAQPKLIGQRQGASFDDDEVPLDMEGKPLKVDKNADYNVMRMSDGSIRHQETTAKTTITNKDKELKRAYELFAFKNGKDVAALTPPEKALAEQQMARLTPQKATEFDKRLALYSKDPETYKDLFGRGDKTMLTPKDAANIIQKIDTNAARQFLSGDARKVFKENALAELKDAGVDVKAATAAAAAKAGSLPKPSKSAGGDVASNDVFSAYLKAHNGDKTAALKALKADGWK